MGVWEGGRACGEGVSLCEGGTVRTRRGKKCEKRVSPPSSFFFNRATVFFIHIALLALVLVGLYKYIILQSVFFFLTENSKKTLLTEVIVLELLYT